MRQGLSKKAWVDRLSCRQKSKWPECRAVGLVFFICASFFVSSCRKPVDLAPELRIEHEIAPQPPKVGTATLTVKLTDNTGNPQQGINMRLEETMSHAGMHPAFVDAREVAPGRYQAPLEFTMGGDWIIILHLTLLDGRKVERQLEIRGVQPQ